MSTARFKVASLFCGCGGSDLGTIGGFNYLGNEYQRLPFDIVYAVDFDKPAVMTYNHNFEIPAVCADVCCIDPQKDIPDIDVLIGGFPCQSFSTVNPTKDTNDERANLYKQVVRVLHEKKPKLFVCENVKGLMTLEKGALVAKVTDAFRAEGYHVEYRLLNAANFGVPQRRERVIIVGVRNDLFGRVQYSYPTETNDEKTWVPIKKIVKDLAAVPERYFFSQRAVEGMKNAKPNMKRGLWQDLNGPCLTLTSHLAKVSINSRDPILLVDPKKELYRRFTPREAAGIQSFPDDFEFNGPESKSYKQIGNAVPPVLMWHVMHQAAKALGGVVPVNTTIKRVRAPRVEQMLLAVERKKARMTAKQKAKGFGGKKLTVKRPAKKSPQAKGTRKR